MVSTFKYFAYGSNMFTRRLAARTPSAVAVTTGFTGGRRLAFDKVSRDGSGKCDLERTGTAADRVFGVVYEIALAEKASLDEAEGLGRGYDAETVTVHTGAGEVRALTYVATTKDPGLRPYRWYRALVVAGAEEHALPRGYVEAIRCVEAIDDPDAARRTRNEALLA